jgi:serine/threonine protein kinase
MEVIGKGSSGFVRKALWKSKQSMVAIKVTRIPLDPERSSREGVVEE